MRPAKAPDPEKWVLCRWEEDWPNKSAHLWWGSLLRDGRPQRQGSYPVWRLLASRFPNWKVYRAKNGRDRWWVQTFHHGYGIWSNLIKDKPFFLVGAWLAQHMNANTESFRYFVYEEQDHE